MFSNAQESSEYCEYCRRMVLTRRIAPNHVVHLLISLFCCGPWVIVWLILALSAAFQPFLCTRCGRSMPVNVMSMILAPLIGVGVFLAVIVAVSLIAFGGCSAASRNKPSDPTDLIVVDANKPDAEKAKEEPKAKVEAKQPIPPKPDIVDGRNVAERKSIYRAMSIELAGVIAEADKKFGKPAPGDRENLQRKNFIRDGQEKIVNNQPGVLFGDAERILAEGDKKGWPKE